VNTDRLRTIYAASHPAAGLSVAMAPDPCTALPTARSTIASFRHRHPDLSPPTGLVK
jgi:hypothetical protein